MYRWCRATSTPNFTSANSPPRQSPWRGHGAVAVVSAANFRRAPARWRDGKGAPLKRIAWGPGEATARPQFACDSRCGPRIWRCALDRLDLPAWRRNYCLLLCVPVLVPARESRGVNPVVLRPILPRRPQRAESRTTSPIVYRLCRRRRATRSGAAPTRTCPSPV